MNINLVGQIYSCLGISNHTRSLFRGIIKGRPDDNIRIFPVAPAAGDYTYDLDDTILSRVQLANTVPSSEGLTFIFWSPTSYPTIRKMVGPKAFIVGYFIHEWNHLSDEILKAFESVDKIAVASDWSRDVILANWARTMPANSRIPAEKIVVLPGGIHEYFEREFPPSGRELFLRDRTKRFLMMGKFEERKCWKETLNTLSNITTGTSHLLCVCDDPFNPSFDFLQWASQYGKSLSQYGKSLTWGSLSKKDERLTGMSFGAKCWHCKRSSLPDVASVAALMNDQVSNILVPSRAGGIELPLIEAMATGCVPIVTNYGGMTHYLPKGYQWAIPVVSMVPMYDNRWFPPTENWGTWADPDWGAFSDMIIQMIILPTTTWQEYSKIVRKHIIDNFTYKKIVADFFTSLSKEGVC
jgi:hypothetical protein